MGEMTRVRCSEQTAKILEGVHIETADVLADCAMRAATTLRGQGWQGGGASYDIGVYTGDREDAEKLIGRKLSGCQVRLLERCVRAELDYYETVSE